jgi:hypothetical protein
MKTLTANEIDIEIHKLKYCTYYRLGNHWYDERPYIINNKGQKHHLPVQCKIAFEDGSKAFIENANIDTIIILIDSGVKIYIPLWYNGKEIGVKTIVKNNGILTGTNEYYE